MAPRENTFKKYSWPVELLAWAISYKTKCFSTAQAYSEIIIPGKIHHHVITTEKGLYSFIHELTYSIQKA